MRQIVSRRIADRLERDAPIHARQGTLGQPHHGRHGHRRLAEYRRPEEVRYERDNALRAPTRRMEGDLVDVLHEHVEAVRRERSAVVAAREKGECVARTDAVDFDAIEPDPRRATRPPAAQQRDLVPAGCQPAEDLVQMDLRTTRLRVLPVLPVDEQKSH